MLNWKDCGNGWPDIKCPVLNSTHEKTNGHACSVLSTAKAIAFDINKLG